MLEGALNYLLSLNNCCHHSAFEGALTFVLEPKSKKIWQILNIANKFYLNHIMKTLG